MLAAASTAGGFLLVILWLIYIAVFVLMIVSMWKVYEKAGYPGWATIIPFYGTYVLFEIAGFNGWMMLLMFVPLVNVVISILLYMKLAESFGQDGLFAAGLIFLPFIFFPVLAFGDAEYEII